MPVASPNYNRRRRFRSLAGRQAWGLVGALTLCCLLLLAWCGRVEFTQYRQARAEVAQEAHGAAQAYAARIGRRLDSHFAELHMVALTLLGAHFDPRRISAQLDRSLRHFLIVHRGLHELVLRQADGRKAWSSLAGGAGLNAHAAFFSPMRSNGYDKVGYAEYAPRLGGYVLPIRYAVHDATGRLRYSLGSSFRLERFLRETHAGQPWTLSVIDVRDADVLGAVSHRSVWFPRLLPTAAGVTVPVPGYPFAVRADWTSAQVIQAYTRNALARWALEVASVLILAGVALGLLLSLRKRDRQARRMRYLIDFNVLRARVNRAIGAAEDESRMLQSICELAVRYGHVVLAWIGAPVEDGAIRYLAAAGATDYLDGLPISVSADVPEGRGSAGTTWREQRPLFHASFEETPMLAPWRERARQFGMQATATLPVYRAGSLWGVLTVYHAELATFDEDLKALLEDLADDISSGLDRLDVQHRERALQAELAKTQAYHRALFEHNAAGMCILDDRRLFVDVNPVFCENLGYTPEEMLGRRSAMIFPSDEDFAHFDPETVVTRQGVALVGEELKFRRKDGSFLWAQVLGVSIELQDGRQGRLWSCIDVTALHEARQDIVYQALHDVLTDLPNRRALEQYLPVAIARAGRGRTALAVGIIDLDDFKTVNESRGHEGGDQLLQAVAGRLMGELRQSDFMARLGGDEFVIVFEELNEMYATQQIQHAMERLGRALEEPVSIDDRQYGVDVALSMGIAVYPFDAQDAGELLRKADAAMYQVKRHKQDRTGWWTLSATSAAQPVRETTFDPYGSEAADLLARLQARLAEVAGHFIEVFYGALALDPSAREVLDRLDESERVDLERRQREHLLFLISPGTTLDMIRTTAAGIGRVHALTGVNTGLLARAQGLYRRLLNEQLNETLMAARDRYRVTVAVETRLQDDIQAELEAHDKTLGQYFGSLSLPLPPQGAVWADARRVEMAALGRMPGVLCAVLLRPDARGVLAVEESAGPRAEAFGSILQMPDREVLIDPDSPRGQGLSAQAWRSQQILSTAALMRDDRYASWHEPARSVGLRSALSIPVLNDAGHSVAVLTLYGAYPNQFEVIWVRDFARSLQQRWAQIWFRCSTPALPVPEDRAQDLRQRLFGGGLRMFMQPVVDLRSGHVAKVEALARLDMNDGEVLGPHAFLPLLGDVELDMLFRVGLDQALQQLASWDEQGLHLDLAVNLPPSAMHAPECRLWVQRALERNGIAPGRLTLELLESQRVDVSQRDRAIERLVGLGIKLALDDLGSGYSSLERLASLPFDVIKVDQGLLARMRQSPVQTLSLVRAIVQMGRDFGRDVVVEGLEDAALVEAAGVLGARYGQGFGIARPMPAEGIEDWLQAFVLPRVDEEIHTFVGALAFHWQYLHEGGTDTPSNVEHCPLSRFLEECGLEHGEVARWHANIHAGVALEESSRRLTDWLVGRIREETPIT